MTRRTSYHHGDLRAALVRGALAAVAEGGTEAVTVADTARRAGVSSGAPYRHFSGRRELLGAAALHVAHELHALLDVSGRSAAETLAETARLYTCYVIEHRVGLDLVFAAELTEHDTALTDAGRRLMDGLLTSARTITGRPDTAIDLLEEVFALAHGYAQLHLAGFAAHRLLTPDETADAAATATRHLIAGRRDDKGSPP